MREVALNLLYIGHAFNVRDARAILDGGITVVVDLAYEEPPATLPRELIYLRFPLLDGEGNEPARLRLAVLAVVESLKAKTPTLVGCSAGMSRSPVIAAAALSIFRSEPPEQALQSIVQDGPHDVSPALWEGVISACRDLLDEKGD